MVFSGVACSAGLLNSSKCEANLCTDKYILFLLYSPFLIYRRRRCVCIAETVLLSAKNACFLMNASELCGWSAADQTGSVCDVMSHSLMIHYDPIPVQLVFDN